MASQAEVAQIAELDERARQLRAITRRTELLLRERKQALITAAVTGQLDLAREIAAQAS